MPNLVVSEAPFVVLKTEGEASLLGDPPRFSVLPIDQDPPGEHRRDASPSGTLGLPSLLSVKCAVVALAAVKTLIL